MNRSHVVLAMIPALAGLIGARPALAAPAATGTLTLQVSPLTFASNAGAHAATGTVTRSATAGALAVTLKSGDTSLARVPGSVTIPAGSASATFAVSAVNTNVVRGTRHPHLQASAPGYKPARVELTVTDAAKAALRLTIRPRRFSASAGVNAATGALTRNTIGENARQALVVTLQSSDPSAAKVPATVTIPAGQQNTTFPVSAVVNTANRPHGMATVKVTASAAGFQAAEYTIVVIDVHANTPATKTPSKPPAKAPATAPAKAPATAPAAPTPTPRPKRQHAKP